VSMDFDAKSAARRIEHISRQIVDEGFHDTTAEASLSRYVAAIASDPVDLLNVQSQLSKDYSPFGLLPYVSLCAAADGHALDLNIEAAPLDFGSDIRAKVEINLGNDAWSSKKQSEIPFVMERHKGNY
jgi:hypothetical protein